MTSQEKTRALKNLALCLGAGEVSPVALLLSAAATIAVDTGISKVEMCKILLGAAAHYSLRKSDSDN